MENTDSSWFDQLLLKQNQHIDNWIWHIKIMGNQPVSGIQMQPSGK